MNRKGGYTLLFAMLTAALVLGVAVFIISISKGQYLLSSTARESMLAVYAADSGLECGSFAAANTILSTTTAGINVNSAGNITCGNYDAVSLLSIGLYTELAGGYLGLKNGGLFKVYKATVAIEFGTAPNIRCAQVSFIKGITEDGSYPVTIVESRGYNRTCPSAGITDFQVFVT